MSVETVKVVAERFLKSSKPEVLALKGSWGVGKTYTWNQIVISHKDSTALQHYCYISLFGISSISQLALSIFTSTRDIKLIDTKLNWNVINKNWFSLLKNGLKSIPNYVKNTDIPYSKNLSVGLDQLAPSMINETIICLDDFERSQLTTEELMGFISCLKEEKNCKVILIFNQEKLGGKEEKYEEYREKVIDIELLFSPTPTEAIIWAFPQDMPWRNLAEKQAMILQIVNIRLLRKIADLIDFLKPVLEHLHAGVIEQAVTTLVLLAWSYYDKNENKPDLAFIRKWNSFISSIGEKDKEKDKKTIQWESILRNYGFIHTDEFDFAISKVIEYGHIEETGLIEEAKKLNDQFKARDLESSFAEAWKLFNNTFSDNKNELITTLHNSFKKSCLHISPSELNSTVRLLRELGDNNTPNEMIDYYIKERGNTPNVFDLENQFSFANNIDDALLRERFKQVFETARQLPTLLDTVMSIAEHNSWSKEQIQVIENATENDYYQLFLESQGDKLGTVVFACLWFGTVSGYQHLAEKPKKALSKIGSQSELNALRVRRFGITTEPTPVPNTET